MSDMAAARKPVPAVLLVVFVAILVIDRMIFQLFAGPLPDEAYYWLWGQHPDWSYFDHPPLQAWLQGLSAHLFGNSLFGLRTPALLTTAVDIACLLWWVRRLREDGIALGSAEAVAATFASPLIFVFTAMVFNDHLLIALLAVASVLVRITLDSVAHTGRPARAALYGAALAAGLAILTKYNGALFVLGVLPVLLLRSYRPIWRSPHLYLALLVALACLVPIVIWNLQHAGASLQYNLVDRTGWSGLAPFASNALTFLLGFLLTLSPPLIVPLARLLAGKGPATPAQPVAATTFATSTLAVILVSAFTFALYYWNIVAAVALFPLIVAYIRTRLGLIAHLVFGALFVTAFVVNSTVVPLSDLFGGRDDESGMLYDWPAIAAEASADLASTGATFLAASDYRNGAILGFTADDPDIQVFSSRESQFDFWRDDAKLAGRDAVIVTDLWHPLSPDITRHFTAVTRLGGHDVIRFDHLVAHDDFYLGTNYRP